MCCCKFHFLIVLVIVLCARSVSSYRYGDHWIGLQRGALPNCTCELAAQAIACVDCQASWVWSDRVPMTYFAWRTLIKDEPGLLNCGRLNSLGWADFDCDAKLGYICERYEGECCIGIIVTTHLEHPNLCPPEIKPMGLNSDLICHDP